MKLTFFIFFYIKIINYTRKTFTEKNNITTTKLDQPIVFEMFNFTTGS